MKNIVITKEKYPSLFGGIGFHNNEALLYPIIEKEHFEQLLCKCYREISPGFMRTCGGYDDWTRESMDAFTAYYEKMQKVTDTPIYLAGAKGKVHFSDEEMKLYCERVADSLAYLKQEKGVGHLRYYCYSNEMSCGTWGDLMTDLPTFKKYHEYLFSAFNTRKLDIGLLSTDASGYENWKTADWAMEHMKRITEDYSLHIYERDHDAHDLGFYDFFYEKCYEYVIKAIKNDGKRMMLTEFGIQKGTQGQLTHHKGVIADVCRYYDDPDDHAYCALMLTEMVFAAINAGVFALSLWTYTDYPDPYSCGYSSKDGYAKKWSIADRFISGTTDVKYNKWGMFTWEDDGTHEIRDVYFCMAPLMKLFKRNAKVLSIDNNDPLLRICALLNRDGSVSVGIVNRHQEEVTVSLDSSLFKQKIRVYEYDPQNVPRNKFGDIQDYCALLSSNAPTLTLKGESVTFLTTDYKEKEERVEAENVEIQDEKLSWSEVTDERHCYYRVYAAKTPNFEPNRKTQIASTVGTDIPIENPDLFYRVLSVDCDGNV